MSELRKEFLKHKQQQESIIDEASTLWVEKNIVLIHEKMNRQTIKSLTNKILKFDSDFGIYKDQLPAVADMISNAEEGLQKVLTGRANDQKAMNMLKQLGYLYNTFSSFFRSDLPVILSTPLFNAAKENPDVKLNVLQAPRHNASVIRDAFKNGLNPNAEEKKLIRKIYRGKVPLIDSAAISNQLLNLSYNELQSLSKLEKVPMIDVASAQAPETAPEQEQLAESKKKRIDFLAEAAIDQQKAADLQNRLQQILKTTNIPGMEDVNASFKQLLDNARKELATGKWNIPGKPTASKQLISFYNILANIQDDWQALKRTYADGEITDQDKQTIKTILDKSAKESQGLIGRLARGIGLTKPHFPGLEPETVVNSIMTAMEDANNLQAVDTFFNATKKLPEPEKDGGPPAGSESADTAQQSTGTSPADKTEVPRETKPSSSTGKPLVPDEKIPMDKMSSLLKTLEQQGFQAKGQGPEALQALLKTINDAGLELKPSSLEEEISKDKKDDDDEKSIDKCPECNCDQNKHSFAGGCKVKGCKCQLGGRDF